MGHMINSLRVLLLFLGFFVVAISHAGEMDSILENSTSPDGKFALLVKSIPDSEVANLPPAERPKPGEAVSLFLLQKKGHRVLREIDPAFRGDNTRNDESYSSRWSRGSDRVAVVYATPARKWIVVYERSKSGWEKLPLPEFDWRAPLRAVAEENKMESPNIGATMGDFTFKRDRITVSMDAKIRGDKELSVELIYSYKLAGKEWTATVDSCKVLP
jgi:hypothetical protein